ncbi:class I SAM-dependent methyltransferase [Merismopedia glauca]|uniref:Methyltransferase domain-containing protein n=1 Tax=Merismopedia glauca CCAP 1448/3 TaxID=1296344 RepID=A0A2T1BZM6_9CYAN|nr:class I SAM-dependent methyltransferase [Merismopedia glauca]PSB01476.1 hypothetical protein C7B64_18095 [Merismopedia glauca CCAP 1448/3]
MWQNSYIYDGKISDVLCERYQLDRQGEEQAISDQIEELLAGRHVLELGCGAGGLTESIAKVAASVLAIDNSPELLAVAVQKELLPDTVEFRYGDLDILSNTNRIFDAALVNFWFSHLSKNTTAQFLRKLHSHLSPGAIVFIVDHIYLPEAGDRLFNQPGKTDTFKVREFGDGIKQQIVRNYYDADKLRNIFALRTSQLKIQVGNCFWWVNYRPI